MGGRRREASEHAGFSPALCCLIRQWRALEPWIEGVEPSGRRYAFDAVELRKILSRRVVPIDKAIHSLADLNVIAKVTFGGQLFVRSEEEKRGYKGPLFEAIPGNLIISKIRVGQGSFCIVGDDIGQLAVSPEYPVYTLDRERVDPRYLALVLRTPEFLAQLTGSASGNTTKRRIRPGYFESLRIPLPSLEQQRAIVTAYDAALARAADMEHEAAEIETEAASAFESALGFGSPAPLPDRPAFIASFRDLDRWSHEGILRRLVEGYAAHVPTYPVVKLRDVIADLENGWSPKCYNRPAEGDEWGVLKVSAISTGQYREEENKALPAQLKARSRLEVQQGDVLITRASGVAHLVGVAAYVGTTRKHLMICDKIFRVVHSHPSQIDPQFLASVLSIHVVRSQIEREFSTKSGMMKNVSKPVLLSLSIPLPPLSEQMALVKALLGARTKAAILRQEAADARAAAWAGFEAAVYMADKATAVA